MEARQRGEAITALSLVSGLALAEGRIEVAVAASRTVAVDGGDVDEGADEGDVEDDGDEGREHVAREAAQQQQPDAGVEHGGAGDALDGADAVVDGQPVVVQAGEEVGVDAEDEGAAEELDAADEPLQELEGEAGLGAHGCGFAIEKYDD